MPTTLNINDELAQKIDRFLKICGKEFRPEAIEIAITKALEEKVSYNLQNSQTDPPSERFPECPYRNSDNRCISLKPKIHLDRNRFVTSFDCSRCQETEMIRKKDKLEDFKERQAIRADTKEKIERIHTEGQAERCQIREKHRDYRGSKINMGEHESSEPDWSNEL